MGRYAWVTLATNDAYSLGALVLAHSLRRVGTSHELACMITPGVTAVMREKLATVFSLVQEVNVLDSKDEVKLALLARPELGITFTKLHCWKLTQYEKCVFLDADTLVVRNCDELFEREELSAAPDVGWPDCFNSGVFVFRPSQETFASITAFAAIKGSFDGGDQGLLNMYFSDWATKDISKHLPFIYNMCSTATYSYLPAFKQFGEDVRIIHFIGITKPWLQYFDTLTGVVQPPPGSTHLQPLLQLWWNIFCEQVHSQLTSSMATSTLAPIWHAFAPPSYVPSIPELSVYSDERNRDTYKEVYSRAPDFSEFKDPWEEYSSRNDPFPNDNRALSDNSKNCYCGYEKEAVVHQNDHNISHGYNQQFHHESQHSSYVPAQTYDQQQYSANNEYNQHREHTISHSGENHSQGHSVQHTEHHHWQQFREQKHQHHEHHVEQHQPKTYNEQWNEQRYHQHHEQHQHHQHHEHRHHDEQHHHNSRQHSEHHHDSRPHDRNKTDDYSQHQSIHQESRSNETRHETHTHYANDKSQASHQNTDYQTHTYNDSHVQHITSINQHAQDNLSSHCYQCSERKQSLEAANTQTDTRRIDFLPSSPASCIDLHNVAMRSDPNVTEHLDNANMGIAGALAQMTLGTVRSAEQTALEEHMRKQSWEQGQIDYMGRDSFENIWKKICETLSFVPQRQPTPPEEDTTKSAESTAIAEPAAEFAAEPVAPMSVEVGKPVVEADKDPIQSLVKDFEKQLLVAQTTCEIGNVIAAQSPEQKAPALSSEEHIETAAMKISSESTATGDVCAKPTIEPKDVKVCETCTEMPSPKPPVESLPAETIAEQCKLVSPQTTQDVAPQSETLPPETKESPQIVSQVSTCLLTDVVCKPPAQEVITPVTQTDSMLAPTEAKSEIPTSAIQDITQLAAVPISIGSPQTVAAPPVASEAPIKDTAKSAIEVTSDVTQPLTIDPSERHAEMLLAASEISTVSPVPIQVAESVLQAEPKESVSGAAAAVSDQAIATTVTAVHESTDVASTVGADQLNGSASEGEKCADTATVAAIVPGLLEKTGTLPETAKELASVSLMMKDASSELPSAIERKIESSSAIPLEAPPPKMEKLAESAVTKVEAAIAKPSEQITKTETAETKPAEEIVKMETAEAKPIEQIMKTETAEAKSAEQIVKTETAEAKTAEQIVKTEAAEAKPAEQIAKTEAAEAKPAEQIAKTETAEAKPAEQIAKTETAEAKPAEQIAKTETAEAKPPAQIAKTKTTEGKSVEQIAKAAITATKQSETTKTIAKAEEAKSVEKADVAEVAVAAESPVVEQSPPIEEPIETKTPIPLTPTVTEATPPTSPSVESAQEEATKKTLKKSDSADGADGEGADKKGTKKTVKKVVKKPKAKAEEATPTAEGAVTATAAAATAADNSQSKSKKTVKVTKKIGAKTGQTLETDTSVPETPPPPSPSGVATSDTPVPPKRKTKPTTTVSTKGTTGKKSETEE